MFFFLCFILKFLSFKLLKSGIIWQTMVHRPTACHLASAVKFSWIMHHVHPLIIHDLASALQEPGWVAVNGTRQAPKAWSACCLVPQTEMALSTSAWGLLLCDWLDSFRKLLSQCLLLYPGTSLDAEDAAENEETVSVPWKKLFLLFSLGDRPFKLYFSVWNGL